MSVGIDGKFEGVEATHTASRAGVKDHLSQYLEKARELGTDQLGGFVHVSVSPKAAFDPEEIRDWTEKFVEAGFQRDRVKLMFGQGLVRELTEPEFARSRIEVLGVQDLPTQFRLYRSKVGPDENRLGTSFIPNWEDFEKGRIHRPELAATVTEKLSRDRVALVRGIGASGKTVLAWLLAQEVVKQGLPAYFFDLTIRTDLTLDLVNALVSDLKRFGHPQVLLVLDNIHIDETSAKELYLAWEEIPLLQRPRLLLIGRETRTAKGSAIESLRLEALTLQARQTELRGVFRRLALREQDEAPLPAPPEPVLTNWLRTFGGNPDSAETTADLIAFSAAVNRRIGDLRHGRWELTHGDAIEQMKEVYLRKLSPLETENLIRLCVAAEFEVSIPIDALADKSADLTKCNKELGIVFREEYGRYNQYARYRLIHPALSELLLLAADRSSDRVALLREMSFANPIVGMLAAVGMQRSGKKSDAKALVASLVSTPDLLLKFDNLVQVLWSLHFSDRLDLVIPEEFDPALARKGKNRNRLIQIALQTQPNFLINFLRYTEKYLPYTFVALKEELADTKNQPRLVETALQIPLGELTTFLNYCRGSLPTVFIALSKELADTKNQPRLVETALQMPLGELTTFLNYCRGSLPTVFIALSKELADTKNQPRLVETALQIPLGELTTFLNYCRGSLPTVFIGLSKELADTKNQPRLVETALQMPLGELTTFLNYCRGSLPTVFIALSKELADTKNQPRLVETALQMPLGELTTFLNYCRGSLPTVFIALSKELADTKNQPRLVETALRMPIDQLARFLRFAKSSLPTINSFLTANFSSKVGRLALAEKMRDAAEDKIASTLPEDGAVDIWQKAFNEIDLQEWRDSRKYGPPPSIDAFVKFQRVVSNLGKAEFASAPADRMVLNSSQSDWQRSGIGLHHLSHVLRLSTGTTDEQKWSFVVRVTTPEWLNSLYQTVHAGALAGSLFALSNSLSGDALQYFNRETLQARIANELRLAHYPASWAAALSLWGAAALLRLPCDTRGVVWPNAAELEQVLQLRAPAPERETIRAMDAQLWLGLRLMAAEVKRPFSVPTELGDRVLELWHSAQVQPYREDLPQRIVDINEIMVPWLEACQSKGWLLVPPPRTA